ncbi:hypothetical protein AKJ09_02932 [Labilithrix luteola]|uniref:Farnesoic acid O-methyl transferase domain-containing protein n=2 Tax=Labilithrix luteola TaxID=1391654 RepID=A0A0K1PRW6_9BACT|nr:hypothetical protein AKJ09_02932 [Labilithrix luteola]
MVIAAFAGGVACVPTGNAPPYDGGANTQSTAPSFKPSTNIMTAPFEDNFDRPDAGEGNWPALNQDGGGTKPPIALLEAGPGDARADATGLQAEAGGDAEGTEDGGRTAEPAHNLGPNWTPIRTNAWRIENGKLCVQGARNHPVWLNKVLPVNARIEFDAVSYSDDGDLKAEIWGDGKAYATGTSYTNATSYLTILGGWKNSMQVLARLNEHGTDRKEIHVDKDSDDPRQRAVNKGQVYHFKIERTDGKTIRWFVDGVEYLSWQDPSPLAGQGHDHFGFNEWDAKVCFDNLKITPLGG